MGTRSTPEKFLSKLAATPTGCSEWNGARQKDGYGILTFHRQSWLAHRLAWTLANGEIPAGKYICHDCDNPPCCNPAHLFVGTQVENMADMREKGRRKNINNGSDNGRAKLTREAVDAIRKEYANGGVTQKELATLYGVNQTNISMLLRRVSWR